VRLWRLPSGEPAGELQHEGRVKRVVLSHDGRRLATLGSSSSGDTNWSVYIWETETGAKIGAPIPFSFSAVCVLAFTDPAGKRLMLGGDGERKDKRLYFVDVDTRKEVLPSREIPNPRCWAFSPDGQSVAIGQDGAEVSILNPLTGKSVFPTVRHSGFIESLDFARDGSRLLTTSEAGTAVVWKLKRPSPSQEMHFDAAIPKWAGALYQRIALDLRQPRLVLR
jgi:WD40 repeat protein